MAFIGKRLGHRQPLNLGSFALRKQERLIVSNRLRSKFRVLVKVATKKSIAGNIKSRERSLFGYVVFKLQFLKKRVDILRRVKVFFKVLLQKLVIVFVFLLLLCPDPRPHDLRVRNIQHLCLVQDAFMEQFVNLVNFGIVFKQVFVGRGFADFSKFALGVIFDSV